MAHQSENTKYWTFKYPYLVDNIKKLGNIISLLLWCVCVFQFPTISCRLDQADVLTLRCLLLILFKDCNFSFSRSAYCTVYHFLGAIHLRGGGAAKTIYFYWNSFASFLQKRKLDSNSWQQAIYMYKQLNTTRNRRTLSKLRTLKSDMDNPMFFTQRPRQQASIGRQLNPHRPLDR